jgi:tetratricopeptide (TPR) repeat protein
LDSLPTSPRLIDRAHLLTAAAQALANLNHFDDAVTTARAAHRAYLDAGYPARAFKALDNIGGYLQDQGLYEESLPYHRAALDYFADTDNVASRAGASVNLGSSLYMLGHLQEATIRYEQALHWFETSGDRRGIIAARINLGELLLDQDEPSAALPLLQSALTESENAGERKYRPYIHFLIGRAYQMLGASSIARHQLQEALQLARATHHHGVIELAQRLLDKLGEDSNEAA